MRGAKVSFTHRWLEWLGKGLQIPIMQVRVLSDAPHQFYATLAQMVEHLTCNEDVVSSILTSGSIFSPHRLARLGHMVFIHATGVRISVRRPI